jgi:N-acetylglucosaminyldiphosphoundecaprenol N-acetyl-beta-D-mannosaminyltransferase
MNIKYPRALVVGSYSPPYKDVFSNDENEFFIRLMNESGADIFWVGLGAPKQ